jgi:hypothetical protein
MKAIATTSILLTGALAAVLIPAAARADEFLAMPGLWRTTYEVDGTADIFDQPRADAPRVVWHCVDEAADPWLAFAQLQDLPGMTCRKASQERNSTSLKWQAQCRGPGPDTAADVVEVSGSIVFDSPQHYRGSVRISGTLMGYPVQTRSKVEGTRKAACTSPAD